MTVLANEQVVWRWRVLALQEHRAAQRVGAVVPQDHQVCQELLDDLDQIAAGLIASSRCRLTGWDADTGAEVDFTLCDAMVNLPLSRSPSSPLARYAVRCSFFLLAPEHPLVREFVSDTAYEAEVARVVELADSAPLWNDPRASERRTVPSPALRNQSKIARGAHLG
jgi:hypothetical protein